MRIQAPLDDLLASRSHVRLLRALAQLPRGLSRSGRDLARRAGVAHPTASRILGQFAEQGVVTTARYGRADMSQLNAEHVLYSLIQEMFALEDGLPERLRSTLRNELRRVSGITEAYLFGSAARAQMRPSSDIDVAVVAEGRTQTELEPFLDRVKDRVRRTYGSEVGFLVRDRPLRKGRANGAWRNVASEGVSLIPQPGRVRASR